MTIPTAENGMVQFVWAGDMRTFRLTLGQLRELQTLRDAGPEELKNRIVQGTWRIDDLREILRLGLIGGGMDAIKALALLKLHFETVEPMKNKIPAYLVIGAGLSGTVTDEVGKKDKVETSTATDDSVSPPSTEQESSSVSVLDKLMN